MSQVKCFPADCTVKCLHYRTWDLSIDDWVSYCDLLKRQVDDCDSDYVRIKCPLENFAKEEQIKWD